MICRFLPALCCTLSTAFGGLLPPDPARLPDYLNWFAPLVPGSGLVAPGDQCPAPSAIDDANRSWGRWSPNAPPTNLPGPITGVAEGLYCEVVFLGETGDCWGRFGYTNNGADHLLSSSAADRTFGSYALPLPTNLDQLDFFVERLVPGADPLRYYAFDLAANSPGAAADDSYWGLLAPRTYDPGSPAALAGAGAIPFAVFALESPSSGDTRPPDLFVYAVRAGYDRPADPVPEPATYGIAAGAALLGLAALRRRRSSRPVRD